MILALVVLTTSKSTSGADVLEWITSYFAPRQCRLEGIHQRLSDWCSC